MVATLVVGCAKRYRFDPAELDKIQTISEDGVSPLRVYPNRRLIAIYDEADVSEKYQVQRSIREASDRNRIKEIVTRNTAGQIVEISEKNGAPFLAVTFDPSCRNAKCAYGFVQTEDGTFRLARAPTKEGYAQPRLFRGCVCKRRRLKLGKMKSLAEQNRVYLAKKRSGKILTINLQVKKIVDKNVRTKVQRSRGIE